MERCKWYEQKNRHLKLELRVATSHERQTKCQIRMDYEWDGEEAKFSDSVSSWVKTYLFPWMNYSSKPESLSSFVWKIFNWQKGQITESHGKELYAQQFR